MNVLEKKLIGLSLLFLAACGNSGGGEEVISPDSSDIVAAEDFPSCTENCEGKYMEEELVESDNSATLSFSSSSCNDAVLSSSVVVFSSSPDSEECNGRRCSSIAIFSSSSSLGEALVSSSSIEYGTLTDSRDGKTYRTVVIGVRTWMAENLNYETENSFCYDDDPDNCDKYGRLYTWAAAVDSAGIWSDGCKGCGSGSKVHPDLRYPNRGVCPRNWHLPSKSEYINSLVLEVGGSPQAGKMLKTSSDWNGYDGFDSYGFSALPSGYRDPEGEFKRVSSETFFWSSTDHGNLGGTSWQDNFAYAFNIDSSDEPLFNDDAGFNDGGELKASAFAVRCIHDWY